MVYCLFGRRLNLIDKAVIFLGFLSSYLRYQPSMHVFIIRTSGFLARVKQFYLGALRVIGDRTIKLIKDTG